MNNDEHTILNSLDKKDNLYFVPADYFETLPALIIFKIRLKESESKISFPVPQNYFSTFPDKILSKIKSGIDEEPETPILNSISKANVYSVPEGYFESLNLRIYSNNIDTEKQEAKIIPLHKKRNVWSTAAAAAVIFAFVLSASLFWENKGSRKQDNSQVSYAQTVHTNISNIQEDLSKVSDQDIESYLDSPDGSDEDTISQTADAVKTQSQLNKLSNQDVENYLNQTPSFN